MPMTMQGSEGGLGMLALAYATSCLGCLLGLSAMARARSTTGGVRARWLGLGAVSIGGAGIWAMHFIAMLGFTVVGSQVRYNVPLTFASLLVAIGVVGVGVFVVTQGDGRPAPLLAGGLFTGLGVAAMHYLGMAAVRVSGQIHYAPWDVGASVVIATIAATAALWASLSIRNPLATLGASLVMGVAVSAMHYVGMSAVRVHVDPGAPPPSGATAMEFVFPLTVGLGSYLFLTAAYVGLSDGARPSPAAAPAPSARVPAPAPVPRQAPPVPAAAAAHRPLAEGPIR